MSALQLIFSCSSPYTPLHDLPVLLHPRPCGGFCVAVRYRTLGRARAVGAAIRCVGGGADGAQAAGSRRARGGGNAHLVRAARLRPEARRPHDGADPQRRRARSHGVGLLRRDHR